MITYSYSEEIIPQNDQKEFDEFPQGLINLNINHTRLQNEFSAFEYERISVNLKRLKNQIISISGFQIPSPDCSSKIFEDSLKEFANLLQWAYRLEIPFILLKIDPVNFHIDQSNIEKYYQKISEFLSEFLGLAKQSKIQIIHVCNNNSNNTPTLENSIKFLENLYHKFEFFGLGVPSESLYFDYDKTDSVLMNYRDRFFIKSYEISEPFYVSDSIFNLPPNFRYEFPSRLIKSGKYQDLLYLGSMNALTNAPESLYNDLLCRLYSTKYLKVLDFIKSRENPELNYSPKRLFEEEILPDIRQNAALDSIKDAHSLLIDDFESTGVYRGFCINEMKKISE